MTVPYDFTPRVLKALELMGKGYTPSHACDDAQINYTTFLNYVKRSEELQHMYVAAEQRGYDEMAEALLRPDLHDVYGHSDTKQQKIISDNIKWFLARRAQHKYGEKVIIENHITADKAIIDALDRGKQRALTARAAAPEIIEGVFEEIVQMDDDEDVSQFV